MRVNGLLKARRDAMMTALEAHLPETTWSRPDGGYFTWLEFPEGIDAAELARRAEGVTLVLGTDFGGPTNTARLAYSFVSPGRDRRRRPAARCRSRDVLGQAIAPAIAGRGTSRGWRGGCNVRPMARKVGHGRSSTSAHKP